MTTRTDSRHPVYAVPAALADATGPEPYTAQDSARDTLDMLNDILATSEDRDGTVEELRAHYAWVADNHRVTDFTREVARLIRAGLPEPKQPRRLRPVR